MTDLSPRTDASTANDAGDGVRRRRKWLPIVMLGLVLVAGGVIVTQFLRTAVDYYCNVDEVDVRSGCDTGRRLRVQGIVEAGSIVADGPDTDFVIAYNGATMPVRFEGDPGGIFKECLPVVVHGQFNDSGTEFMGDLVEVKHSNEYVAVNDERLSKADDLADDCEANAS